MRTVRQAYTAFMLLLAKATDREQRPHQAKENEVLVLPKSTRAKRVKRRNRGNPRPTEIDCRELLGGLLKHYYRKAA